MQYYSIVYDSVTGNTLQLAQTVQHTLPAQYCFYVGPPDDHAMAASVMFVGFWTNMGTCDPSIALFLQSLHGKQVFLFGTAGFSGSQEYLDKIIAEVGKNLPSDNKILGSFMCQGKMPAAVREKYESMKAQDPSKMQEKIRNFVLALSHPNKEDLQILADRILALQLAWE